MTNITQEQLISSLKQLKEIKPRKEWAVLLKSQIMAEKKVAVQQARFTEIMDTLKFIFAPKKLAYSFAVVLFLIVGIFGVSMVKDFSQKQTASLIGANQQTAVIKNQINATVRNIAQNLKANSVQDSQTMKILAKTLADIPGTDLTASQDVKDLYQTVVQSQITDLEKTTLTDEQDSALTEIKNLYDQGKYTEALEKILLINN